MTSYLSVPRQILFPVDQSKGPYYAPGWDDWRDQGTRRHRATDIYPASSVYAAYAVPLYACADGVVDNWIPGINQPVNVTSGGGYQFRLNTHDGKLRYCYMHLGPAIQNRASEAFAPAIQPGATLKRGDLVGWLGESGSTASGQHLHFEIRGLDGNPDDDPYANYDPARRGFEDGPRYDPYPSLQVADRNWVDPTFSIGSPVITVRVPTYKEVTTPFHGRRANLSVERQLLSLNPGQVAALTTQQVTAVRLQWDDAEGGPYEVRRNGVILGSVTQASFVDSSAEVGGEYTYNVRSGEGPWSFPSTIAVRDTGEGGLRFLRRRQGQWL